MVVLFYFKTKASQSYRRCHVSSVIRINLYHIIYIVHVSKPTEYLKLLPLLYISVSILNLTAMCFNQTYILNENT